MSFFKSNKKMEENTQLREEILELTRKIQNNNSIIEKIQEESIQSRRTFQELIAKQKEEYLLQRTQLDNSIEKITLLEERMNNFMQITDNQSNEPSTEATSKLEERIDAKIALLTQSQENAQTRITTFSQALDMLGNGVEELNQLIKQQSTSKDAESDKEESGEDWSKQTTNEVISTIKDEQKELFDKFSEIVSQFNENFRKELTNTVNTLQDSHERILGEIGDHYMPKSIGYELQQLLNDFSNEFKFETQNLRVQIVNIKYYQKELQQFKQEIQTLIDHKVNERYNAISQLLTTVTAKTEEISLYLRNSDVQVTPSDKQSDFSEDHRY
ncbi:MAG: hypothetical protein KAT16_02855 [Candidatus Heimdallarchaeota archaeon]|nr:hypothetical protein [Candidatus Heimdallarchaeota archaeon]